MIFKLSKFISIPLLIDWLGLREFLLFDSAICNVKCREILFSWIFEYRTKFQASHLPSYKSLPLSLRLFEWASARKLRYNRQKIVMADKQIESFNAVFEEQKERLQFFTSKMDTICVTSCSYYNVNMICQILKLFTDLQYVTLTSIEDINRPVQLLGACCPQLIECTIKQCSALTDESVVTLCRGCPDLSLLDISHSTDLTNISVLSALIHCPELYQFDVRGCTKIKSQAIFMWCLHNRRKRNCHIDFDGHQDVLTRLLIHYYKSGCYAWDLSLHFPHAVVDRTIEELTKYSSCSNIYDLNLQNCSDITSDSFIPLTATLPRLYKINIKGLLLMTDGAIQAMSANCPKLREVNVGYQVMVSDDGWSALGGLESLLRFTCVKIYLCHALKAIFARCTQLQFVQLCEVAGLTDDAICAASHHMTSLEKLMLQSLQDISDRGLGAIATGVPKLNVFSLYGCEKITDASIIAVVLNSPKLDILAVQDIRLTKLLIHASDKISGLLIWRFQTGKSYVNKGRIIMKRCKKLNVLQVQHLTEDEVVELQGVAKEMGLTIRISNQF